MSTALFIIVAVFLIFLSWIIFPVWMIKRTTPKIVRIFQENNAIGIENARTLEELKLTPKNMLKRMFSGHDWRTRTLQIMVQRDAVLSTEDGRLYVTEESLANVNWVKLKK